MPPRVKFQREEIVSAALAVAGRKGIDAVTAREVAAELNVSTRPIFTWFSTMDELKAVLYTEARERYRACIERGLAEDIPFLGVWRQYIRFAREEPELYKLLFLSKPGAGSGGTTEILRFSQDLVRPSLMRIYHMSADHADSYFRNMWLMSFSIATLIVTGDCPWTEEEIFAIGAEVSLSICKAYKEIPGLPEGKADKDAIFRELVRK
jgi:AcrR family transcriptional regulator